jgi:hypothetical protein
MPPVRGGRASLACESCRKQKTRCYASGNQTGGCLRCETLAQPCSLAGSVAARRIPTGGQAIPDDRLGRLEHKVESLLRRLNEHGILADDQPDHNPRLQALTSHEGDIRQATPPMQMIRSLAKHGVVHDAMSRDSSASQLDVIDSGLVSPNLALSMLSMF